MTTIVDAHVHILPPSFRENRKRLIEIDATFAALFSDPKSCMATSEDLISAMDKDGVSVAVALGYGWCDQGVAREANDYLLEAARRFPGRIVPFCGVNPNWGRAAVLEVERCFSAGARGVGELHPDTAGFDLGDKATLAPLMELVKEYGHAINTHSSEPLGHSYPGKGLVKPDILMRFILNFPEVNIICSHWGGGLPFYALMPEVRSALGNVYFDSAASPLLYGPEVFQIVTQLLGAKHILLGSDYPLVSPGHAMQQAQMHLSEEELDIVLGNNSLHLLGTDIADTQESFD